MATPRQQTKYMLEVLKGWNQPHAVDFVAKISANVTIDPVAEGTCMHLNAVGEFETGVPDAVGSGKIHMPIFLFGNSDDPDVANPGGIDEPDGWQAIGPTGAMVGFVATGAYELATTQFIDDTYAPGDALKAPVDNDDAAVGGVLAKGTPYTDPIVGTVSRGVTQNHRRDILCFWPLCLPPTP